MKYIYLYLYIYIYIYIYILLLKVNPNIHTWIQWSTAYCMYVQTTMFRRFKVFNEIHTHTHRPLHEPNVCYIRHLYSNKIPTDPWNISQIPRGGLDFCEMQRYNTFASERYNCVVYRVLFHEAPVRLGSYPQLTFHRKQGVMYKLTKHFGFS